MAASEVEPITCAEVRPLVRLFLAGELRKESSTQLRAHVAGCQPCMDFYREAVSTTATLGRMTSEEREQRMLERQRNARAAVALGRDPQAAPKRRHFRLRMVLIPAVVIYVLTRIANLGPAPGKVELVDASRGVTIDERVPDLSKGPSLVLPGRWVLTDRFANASLDAQLCEVHLGSSTDLLVESARPLRFRLGRGSVSLEGSAKFVTIRGLIEVEAGRGSLSLGDPGLVVEPEAGTWRLHDSTGAHALELGRPQSFP
jgi:hypothetical protein